MCKGAIIIATPKVDPKYHPWLIMFGLNVAYYRKLKNLTQEELSEITGVSRTTLGHIENADKFHSTSLATIFKLADALDVPVKTFFDFKDEGL